MTTAHTTAQRRHFSRILFAAQGKLLAADGNHPCQVHDLSLKGALVAPAGGQWPDGKSCTLEVRLGDDHATVIHMQAEVAHSKAEVVGLRCKEIDIDSITHLRRLIELNLGDETLLQRELHALSLD